MTPETSGTQAFAAQYQARREALPGGGLAWLTDLREMAIARFAEQGLPTPRAEAWKYTNLRALEKLSFEPASDAAAVGIDSLPSLVADGAGHPRLVFVNGFLRPELSRRDGLPEGVQLEGLGSLLDREPALAEAALTETTAADALPLMALNAAMMADGAVLRVARGVTVEQPIELVFLGMAGESALAYHPRLLVSMGEDSQATLVELHGSLGDGTTIANLASAIRLEQGARLDHVKLQDENERCYHLSSLRARLGRDSEYRGFGLALGAALSRNEAWVRLEGSGSHCRRSEERRVGKECRSRWSPYH